MRGATTIMLLGGLLFTTRAEAAEVKVLSAGAMKTKGYEPREVSGR